MNRRGMSETHEHESAERAACRPSPDGGWVIHSVTDGRRCRRGRVRLRGGWLPVCRGLREAIETTRQLTGAPFGVNLFVPSAPADPAEVVGYAAALQTEAVRLGVALGEARWEDDSFDAKLDVATSTGVHLVSFTFGCPTSETVDRLHGAGVQAAVTVTSVLEAQLAADAGADLLAVQAPRRAVTRAASPTSRPTTAPSATPTRSSPDRYAPPPPRSATQAFPTCGPAPAGAS